MQRLEAYTNCCQAPEAKQERIALATMLLMGDSGLRRSEAASACRSQLRPSLFFADTWELKVLGKRNKWREVPVSARTIEALKAHFKDRASDFYQIDLAPLLSPITLPATPRTENRHRTEQENHYTANGLYALLNSSIKKLCSINAFTPEEIAQLRAVTAHAFRHTFGTQAVARDVPVDVVQKVLGHASVGTTSIYVQAEKQRIMSEVGQYFTKLTAHERKDR